MQSASDNSMYINGRFLSQPCTGVQRYARQVVVAMDRKLAMAECPAALRSARWYLLAPPGTSCDLQLEHIQFATIGSGGGHAWEQIHLLRHTSGGKLLSLANSGPIFHRQQLVVIHDAAVFHAPAGFSWYYRLFHRSLGRIIARSARIATVSEFARTELARALGVEEARILIASNGADHFRRISADRAIVDRLDLVAGKYFVTLGLSSANKNIALAIEAFCSLNRPETRLVIVGEGRQGVTARQNLESRKGVIFAGRLSDEEVAGLLRSATAFLFPSRYEGFGIPPLEAMAQGCPVIASTAGAVLEVCGDAALHFDPDDADTLANYMQELLDDHEVGLRLRAKGLLRPGRYSWDAAATALIGGLEKLGTQLQDLDGLVGATNHEDRGSGCR